MSAHSIPGPRAPRSSSDTRASGFQFTALTAETKIRIPKDWRGEYVRIAWKPSTAGEVLYYLFAAFADTLPSIDDTTDSSVGAGAEPDYATVDNAPDWIEEGNHRIQVPFYAEVDTVLLLKPSGNPGRVKVRQAEGR